MAEPNYNETHIQRTRPTQVWDDASQSYITVEQEVLEPIYAGLNFKRRWGYCESCQEVFPLDQMQRIGGKYYCFKYNDAKDEILRRQGK